MQVHICSVLYNYLRFIYIVSYDKILTPNLLFVINGVLGKALLFADENLRFHCINVDFLQNENSVVLCVWS